jgi:hypothetical protein
MADARKMVNNTPSGRIKKLFIYGIDKSRNKSPLFGIPAHMRKG